MKRVPPRRATERIVQLSDEDQTFVRSFLIHEDDAVLVFNKPSGLPVQTRDPEDRTLDRLLWAFAKSNGKRPRLVHRLDSQTSGVILAARTQPAAAALSEAFAHRTISKRYIALVTGVAPKADKGVFDAPLARYRPKPELELMRVARPGDAKPQEALTRWKMLSRGERTFVLSLEPKTGRMHQLRAHLSDAGWPIAGDVHYGGATSVGGVPVERLMLHAAAISGPHPDGGGFSFEAPLPDDFSGLLQSAGHDLAKGAGEA